MKYLVAIFFPFISIYMIKKPYVGLFCLAMYLILLFSKWLFLDFYLFIFLYSMLIIWTFFEVYNYNMKEYFENFLYTYLVDKKPYNERIKEKDANRYKKRRKDLYNSSSKVNRNLEVEKDSFREEEQNTSNVYNNMTTNNIKAFRNKKIQINQNKSKSLEIGKEYYNDDQISARSRIINDRNHNTYGNNINTSVNDNNSNISRSKRVRLIQNRNNF